MEPRISNSSLQKGLAALVDMPSFYSKWKEIAGVDLAVIGPRQRHRMSRA